MTLPSNSCYDIETYIEINIKKSYLGLDVEKRLTSGSMPLVCDTDDPLETNPHAVYTSLS